MDDCGGNWIAFVHVGVFLLNENKQYAVLRAANSEGGQIMTRLVPNTGSLVAVALLFALGALPQAVSRLANRISSVKKRKRFMAYLSNCDHKGNGMLMGM